MASPVIRSAVPGDVPAILHIEAQSFASPNWGAGAFSQYTTVVAEVEQQVAGVLVSRETYAGNETTPPETEILNLAVAPKFRRLGVASALLDWILQNPGEFFLEVRESNASAQLLYLKFQFTVVGRRQAYYENPVESALVMKMKRC